MWVRDCKTLWQRSAVRIKARLVTLARGDRDPPVAPASETKTGWHSHACAMAHDAHKTVLCIQHRVEQPGQPCRSEFYYFYFDGSVAAAPAADNGGGSAGQRRRHAHGTKVGGEASNLEVQGEAHLQARRGERHY